MAPKELFQRSKDNVKQGLAIVKHDMFDMLITFAKSEFATRNPTNEQMVGANEFIRTLYSMVDPIDIPIEFPQPGLEHNLDVARKELPKVEPKKS